MLKSYLEAKGASATTVALGQRYAEEFGSRCLEIPTLRSSHTLTEMFFRFIIEHQRRGMVEGKQTDTQK